MRRSHLGLIGLAIAVATMLVGVGFMATGAIAIGGFFLAIGGLNGGYLGFRAWQDARGGQARSGDPMRAAAIGWTAVGALCIAGGAALAIFSRTGTIFLAAPLIITGLLGVLLGLRGFALAEPRDNDREP